MKVNPIILEILVAIMLIWIVYQTFITNKYIKRVTELENIVQIQQVHTTLSIDSIQTIINNQVQHLRDSLNKGLFTKQKIVKARGTKQNEELNTINKSDINLPNF